MSRGAKKPASKKPLITEDMLIGDVINRLPESAEIMQDFGLHCTSCSVNVFEPLKMGALSHGIEEAVVDEMIRRINELAWSRRRAPENGIYMTESAATKVREFAKAEAKEGYGLKITAHTEAVSQKEPSRRSSGTVASQKEPATVKEPAYAMDFQEKAVKGEKTFEFHGVEIYVDPESLKNLRGAEIDFIESAYGSGFKITNPNFVKKACGCGSGTCECGGGSSCGSSDGDGSCACGGSGHETESAAC